jgi:chaperonin GroES
MKLKPIGERVILRVLEQQEKTKSGLYLPKSDDKKQGQVVEVGTFKEGHALPLKKGDKIVYGGYSSDEFDIDGVKHLIIDFKDILAVMEEI